MDTLPVWHCIYLLDSLQSGMTLLWYLCDNIINIINILNINMPEECLNIVEEVKEQLIHPVTDIVDKCLENFCSKSKLDLSVQFVDFSFIFCESFVFLFKSRKYFAFILMFLLPFLTSGSLLQSSSVIISLFKDD